VGLLSDQNFTITPDNGCRIVDVLVDGASVDSVEQYSFKQVGSDHSIEAVFSSPTTAPASTWYLAEGCTEGGMETWVLVQNPGTTDATVGLTLMTGAGEQKPDGLQGQVIPAETRRSFNLGEHVRDWNVSTMVTSTGGKVVCERAVYGNGRQWAHDSVGYAP
jgi:hypothetical protein